MTRQLPAHSEPKNNAPTARGISLRPRPRGMFRARLEALGSPAIPGRSSPGGYLRVRRLGYAVAAALAVFISGHSAFADDSQANGPASGSEPAASAALPTPAAVAGPSAPPSVPAPPPSAPAGDVVSLEVYTVEGTQLADST